MSRRIAKETNVRKLARSGASLVVSLPREILNLLGWKEKQKVIVRKIRGGVTIKDWHNS